MDPDLNKYDLNHVVTGHPLMSREEWEGAYRWRGRPTIPTSTSSGAAAGCRHQGQRRQNPFCTELVHRLDPHREDPPARSWLRAAEVPSRPAARLSDRAGPDVLSAVLVEPCRSRCAGLALGADAAGSTGDPTGRSARTCDEALTPVMADEAETLGMFAQRGESLCGARAASR